MQSDDRSVVLLATGGTIAGTAARRTDNLGYASATVGVDTLVAAVPELAGYALQAEQLAQIDSKDMGPVVWSRLVSRAAEHLARPEVAGLVMTHGTDTLEETAWLLHRLLAAQDKPVVLTGAMRPASSLQADGPQNLLDAVRLAAHGGARGVLVSFGGSVFAAEGLRKRHPYRLDAFGAGDAGPLGFIEEGALRLLRQWPHAEPLGADLLPPEGEAWPRVEIVTSHAGADGRLVDAIVAQGVDGLVVAATGNGTLNRSLEDALRQAAARGVALLRTTRCADGVVVEDAVARGWPEAVPLPPPQARVELLLRLLMQGHMRA